MEIPGFRIFGVLIPYYGFFIMTGALVASFSAWLRIKKSKLDFNVFMIFTGVSLLFGFLGAKILFIITAYKTLGPVIFKDALNFLSLMQAGFVFYGGLIGALLGVFICVKILKINATEYINPCIFLIPLAHGFGRIGCHLTGCCYGIRYGGIFKIMYHDSPFAPNGIFLFPVQLTESAGNFLIAVCLYFLGPRLRKGMALPYYLCMYSTLRFILEYLRDDGIRGTISVFSTSQAISMIMFILSLFYIIYSGVSKKHNTIKVNI